MLATTTTLLFSMSPVRNLHRMLKLRIEEFLDFICENELVGFYFEEAYSLITSVQNQCRNSVCSLRAGYHYNFCLFLLGKSLRILILFARMHLYSSTFEGVFRLAFILIGTFGNLVLFLDFTCENELVGFHSDQVYNLNAIVRDFRLSISQFSELF